MVSEGNITNNERLYRNFMAMVQVYKKDADDKSIKVAKTSKGNWKVFDKTGRKLCLVSKNVLTDAMVDEYKLTQIEDPAK
jgi:hypothetical protein